jgi:flagellar hook-length control protein FliK
MTAPVPISPSVVRAVPASTGANQDQASGASFASALDGALRPERADAARGRHDPDRGASDHPRADRPLPRTRGTDNAPGLRTHGRKEDRRSHEPASGPDDETVPTPGTEAAAVAAPPPWAPALGLLPAAVPTAAESDDAALTPGAAPVGTAATDAPAGNAPAGPASPAPVDLSAPTPAAPTTPPAGLTAAELQALAAAVPQPAAPAAPPADPRPAVPQAAAPAPVAAPVAVPAAPLPAAPAAPATDDVPAAPDASALPASPEAVTAPVAPAVPSAVRTSDAAPAPADPASPAPGTATAPDMTGIPAPSAAGGSGGSASSDPGDQGRQDPTAVSVDTTGGVVGAPLPTVPVVAAAVAAAAAPAAAAPQPVATQLVQHVAVLADGPDGTRSVTVVLHPDSLGPVQVQVTLSQGAIDLTMRGAHEQGRAALMGALPDLRRDLESAGLTCSNIGVATDTGGSWTASNGSAQQQAAQQQAAQQWTGQGRGRPEWSDGRFRPWSRAADTGDSRPIPRSPRSTSPGVDVRV